MKNEKLKVTIYSKGLFGMRAFEGYLVQHGTREYAQYPSAPFVEFVPKGKRKACWIQETSFPSLLIVAGWDQPKPDSPYDPSKTREDGAVTIQEGRYSSCDPRWQTDFDASIEKESVEIIADYRQHNSPPSTEPRRRRRYPMSAGIDYGSIDGANRNLETGIHYGVISAHRLAGCVMGEGEPIYPDEFEAECPGCGAAQEVKSLDETTCTECKEEFDPEYPDMMEPIGWNYTPNDPDYQTECGESQDIFVIKSPYYTRAQFCSPCAPGAGYLTSPCDDGPKTYCLGPDFFDEYNPLPYPVYSVATDELVASPKETAE